MIINICVQTARNDEKGVFQFPWESSEEFYISAESIRITSSHLELYGLNRYSERFVTGDTDLRSLSEKIPNTLANYAISLYPAKDEHDKDYSNYVAWFKIGDKFYDIGGDGNG